MPRNELYAMDASPDESEIGNSFACKLHLFGQFCVSLRVNKIGRNVLPLLDAVSLRNLGRYCCEISDNQPTDCSTQLCNLFGLIVQMSNGRKGFTGWLKQVLEDKCSASPETDCNHLRKIRTLVFLSEQIASPTHIYNPQS